MRSQRRTLKGQATHLNPLRVAPLTLSSPQQGLQARDEDARACRLGDVGVSAELKPEHLIELITARRKHQDHSGVVLTDATADLEPVDSG